MAWRDRIEQLKDKIDDSNLTETQIRNATPTQIKNFLNLSDEQYDSIPTHLWERIISHSATYARRKFEDGVFASILTVLSSPQKQWLKAQDSIQLAERIGGIA